MQIRKCEKADIARVGAFYDNVVAWLDERVNYPEWIYKIYPSEADVREWTEAEGYQALRVDIVDGNEPAKWFFEGHDFVFAGNIKQELGPGIIKEFSLYERNW